MPQFMGNTGDLGVPNVATSIPTGNGFQDIQYFEYPYSLIGVTRNAVGATLPNCLVQLYRSADRSYVHSMTSDANGNYAIPASNLLQHFLIAYLPGSPDVAGTTVNTLTGV